MRTLLFLFVLILSLPGNSQNVVFDWAKQMGGTGWDDGYSIAADASGNIYTIGSFQDTVDFDPGSGVSNFISNGDRDIFIQKLDANGDFLWVKQIGGVGWDKGTSITVDTSGNVYTTGLFSDTVDFDPGAGVYNLSSNGYYDIFIQKLDANGNFLWAKQMGGSGGDAGNSIAADASGNIYTIGSFDDTVDFDPGVGVSKLTSSNGYDNFIQKLDVNGNFLWAKQMGGYNLGRNNFTLDASGNIYRTGGFLQTVDFDPGAGVSNLTSNGSFDVFIQKLDANGNFLWAKQMGSIEAQIGLSIALDASDNVYTAGVFRGTVDFDPDAGVSNLMSNGDFDVFIQKLDTYGSFLWVKQMGGVSDEHVGSVNVDPSGNIYTTGWYTGSVDFDPGAGVNNLTSNGGADIFVQKLDANGNLLWAKQMGGSGGDSGNSIATDASGNIYTIGSFQDTVDFDPDAGVSNFTSNGDWDIFIQKLNQSGIGILEDDFGTEFKLYPNPTKGFFTIDLGKPYDATITISDLTGKIILSKSVENSQRINLNLEEPAGIYFLILESAEKKAVVKLVKE